MRFEVVIFYYFVIFLLLFFRGRARSKCRGIWHTLIIIYF
jgi:hypothetical protein